LHFPSHHCVAHLAWQAIAVSLGALGAVCHAQGKLEEAEGHLMEAMAIHTAEA